MNRLLVVEDDENTAEMLRRYFNTLGYQVFNAYKGQDALRIAREEQPHVILMDIILPDIDGFETARLIRSQKMTDHIPIIFLTDKRDRGNRVQGLRMGVDDYVTKPFDLEELRLRVHNIATRVRGISFVDARTGLPSLPMVEQEMPRLLKESDRHLAVIAITPYDAFIGHYGPVSGNNIIRRTAEMIADILHEMDPLKSFLGHLDDHVFVVRSDDPTLKRLESDLPSRFETTRDAFYANLDLDEEQKVLQLNLTITRVPADAVDDQIAAVRALAENGAAPEYINLPERAEEPTPISEAAPTPETDIEVKSQPEPNPPSETLPKQTYTCPACGFMTFDAAPGSGDSCGVCGWKDDLDQLRMPGSKQGANVTSLFEYQKPFAKESLLMIKERKGYERDPDWRPLRQAEVTDIAPTTPGDEESSDPTNHYYWKK